MQVDDDIKYMRRCLDLAVKAEGKSFPNPVVGSVIVNNGLIIGEGYHLKAGTPHAEAVAIASVKDKRLLASSTLFVNLEPCSHYGKTPPCADLIISSGIRRVVAGTLDTSEKVSGKGIRKLRDSGCEVVTGILENECRWINRRFFCFNEKKRPYIILKWAQSADRYIDMVRKSGQPQGPLWITGPAEQTLVHKWRASEQAILAGAGTVRNDNPMLNVREWTGEDPVRLILSSSGDLDWNSTVFKNGGTNIVFTHNNSLKAFQGTVIEMDRKRSSASQVAEYLYNAGLQSLIVEGGQKVLSHFIEENLWDEARIFYGKKHFGDGIPAPAVKGTIISQTDFGKTSLEIVENDMISNPRKA
jgi:diaminohydroxyphosphoribosylaminopyrimidine deaminase/5-amino-6-(5-phosphoribosylamino)uracil reductase